ncbi:glycosyltransferase [bacterium]|nr:glycosyltransferase [bacterium]
MRKLIFKHHLSPGDIIMLTAAVRDLHRCYPGEFLTDVRTSCPELWENNPYITPLEENDPGVEIIKCHYPLIHRSNQTPYHFIHGFQRYLSDILHLNINPTEFRGDIHLSEEEKYSTSPLEEIIGEAGHYWIIVAGGKQDYTIKWWDWKRFQEIVDYFKGKIRFVQVGGIGHFHPELEGVFDLRGKTDLRQLLRLVYQSDGIICPVTFHMHLAAAVEMKENMRLRPCVVIAGGREPAHWEAYPGHQFIDTIGMLPCCSTGGCWRSRTIPLQDKSKHDSSDNLCINVTGNLPKCMDIISSHDVIKRVEMYLEGETAFEKYRYHKSNKTRSITLYQFDDKKELNSANANSLAEEFINEIPEYPDTYSGKGIIICGGGIQYYTNAWICINMLRYFGCKLPIQLWFLGANEIDDQMKIWLKPLNVECVDGIKVRKTYPARILKGWELKPYSIIYSPFKEVLYLDADNMPVRNPEYLFKMWQYEKTGAVFWPDYGRLDVNRTIWELCGVKYRDEREFETGQILVNKSKCWKALCLTMWYNENSDFFYRHIHGDKETFHMAFRKLDQPYAMPDAPILQLRGTMCQHDFDGRRIFQHRNQAKWKLTEKNIHIEGFLFENKCIQALEELRIKWAESRHTVLNISNDHCDKDNKENIAPIDVNKHIITNKQFIIRARFDGYTGYGLHAQYVVKGLKQFGHDFGVLPIPGNQIKEVPVSKCVTDLFANESKNCRWELMIYPPMIKPNMRLSTIYFTMWETTRLPERSLEMLQKANAIIVPCQWNATSFAAQGLSRPIFICPLGIDSSIFKFREMKETDLCVFGAAGNLSISGRTRKGIETVISAFKTAFPSERDVILKIKAMPEDKIPNIHDNRITIMKQCITQENLAEWYEDITCYVSASKSEAWGLMQQQAMAIGRPVIACSFGGLRNGVEINQ